MHGMNIHEFDGTLPRTDDLAFQPPVDPLLKPGNLRQRASIVHREIPLLQSQTGWDIAMVRAALEDQVIGLFDKPAQLADAIGGDSRVQSAMQSRTGGLLGKQVTFEIPEEYKNDPQAKKCLRQFRKHWKRMATEAVLSELLDWSTKLGFGLAQIVWDTTKSTWYPYIRVWQPRYVYYHWMYRRYIAITMDGQVAVEPGDGHWLLHAPHGEYRGWMRSSIRAIAPWWLARNYALRDWARYSERHGMPIILARTPFGADPDDIIAYRNQLAQLGQESVVQLPGSSSPDYGSYDMDFLEASDAAWQGFQQLINQCNAEITLSLLGQTLTTEVKEGSFAAARVHADVRQSILEADARALAHTLYLQIARPFAAINFGNPDLAPRVVWDINPAEDYKTMSEVHLTFSRALLDLRKAGIKVNNVVELGIKFGLDLTTADIEVTEPLQNETAQISAASSQSAHETTVSDREND